MRKKKNETEVEWWKRVAKIERESREASDECLAMVAETLKEFGCCHGHDGNNTPPMMYPEWVACVVESLRGRIRKLHSEIDCRIEHGAESEGHLEFVRVELERILWEEK